MWTWPWLRIPNNRALVGFSVFEQAIYLDPKANPAGLVTTFVMEWPIGSGVLPEGAEVYKYRDTGFSPTGDYSKRKVPIVRFNL